MRSVLKRAFTLIEVNLAMLVMAGGVLSMVSLYAFGFRESRQSREDVAGAVAAESILNALSTVLSSCDLKWSQWKRFGEGLSGNSRYDIRVWPKDGWKAYLAQDGKSGRGYKVSTGISSIAKDQVFAKLIEGYEENRVGDGVTIAKPAIGDFIDEKTISYAIVATREAEESPVMTLAVRVVRQGQERTLFSQPVYFTEVHFQGVIDTN